MMGREEDRVDLGELIVYHRGGFMPYREATLGLLTHALQYGTGCFEGIRAFWSDEAEQLYVFEPVAHYRRLRRSGNLLLMDLPHTDDELTEITLELCRRNGFRGDAYIRPLLYKSEEFFGVRLDDVGHDLAIVAFPNSKYLDTDDGLKLCVSSWRRVDDNATPARAKITGSYVNVAFAKSEARLNGFDDAIVLSDDGHVSEASAANLFVLRDGVATTPDLSQNLLEGVTRALVTRYLRDELGMRVDAHAQLVAQVAGDERARHAFEQVLREIGRRRDAVTQHEQVRRRGFADVAVVGEHDRIVEAVEPRLALGERDVHVAAGDLRAGRRRVVVDTAPRAHAQLEAVVGVQILAVRERNDRQVVADVVEPHAEELFALVEQRPDVGVAAEAVPAAQLQGDLGQLVVGVREIHEQQVARAPQPPVVGDRLEDVELLRLVAPERSDPLEAPGAVLQRVGQQAQRGLAVRHEAATVIDDELSEVHAVFLPSHHRAAEGRAGWPFGARSGRAMVPLLQRPGIVRVLSVLPRVEIPVRQGPRKRDVGEGEVDRLAVAGIVAADDAVQVGHHRIALNDAHRDRERHRIDFFAPGDEELVGRDQLVQLERLLVAEDLAQPVALDVADRKDVQVQLIALDLERVDPVVRLDDRAHAADHRQRGVVRLGRRHLGDRMRPRGRIRSPR